MLHPEQKQKGANSTASLSQRTAALRTSGIYKLAPEILAQIFVETLPNRPLGIDTRLPPLLLLQVCRLWRDVALATPPLWTTLDFAHPFKLDGPKIFKRWITNSGALPLTFVFETTDFSGSLQQEHELMCLLLHHLDRFEVLEGEIGQPFWDVLLADGSGTHTPISAAQLRRFEFRDKAHADLQLNVESIIQADRARASIHAPELRSLTLQGPWFLMPLLDFNVRQLYRFSLTKIEYEVPALPPLELIHIIRRCENLREMDITLCEEICPDSLEELDPISLTWLTSLRLWIVPECDGAEKFIKALNIPEIKCLEIRSDDPGVHIDFRWLEHLLEKRLTSLVSLKLIFMDLDPPGDLSNFSLWSLGSLESIELSGGFIGNRIFEHLIPQSPRWTTWILPNLHDIKLKNIELVHWTDVIEMITKRVAYTEPSAGSTGALEYQFVVQDNSGCFEENSRKIFDHLQQETNGRFQFRLIQPGGDFDGEEV